MKKKIIAAGGLVTNENNELLMIFRRGKWDLPKGKLDEGETLEECAVREVKEETGIGNVELKNLVDITYHQYFDKHSNETVIKETHWFAMQVKGRPELIPQTEEDIEKIIWADKEVIGESLENTYLNIVQVIEKYKLL